MNKAIEEKALKNIRLRKNEAELTARKNLVFALENKAFERLYYNEKELMIENAKNDALGKPVDKSKLLDIRKKEDEVLKTINLTLKDLSPNYSCPKCLDNGIIEGQYCDCFTDEVNKLLTESLNKKEALKTFDMCDKNTKTAEIMQKWCKLDNQYYNVLICGPTGSGKSFISECVASEMIKNKKFVLFTTAFNLNDNMLMYHTTSNEYKQAFMSNFLDADILIIDDLGTEPILKNVTQEYLYLLINERMTQGKRTIITTNLNLSQIRDRYEDRISSRLLGKQNCLKIYIDNEDLRLNIKK